MELTALVRKSRCAWVRGLDVWAGDVAASRPDLGIRSILGEVVSDFVGVLDLERVEERHLSC